MAYDPSKNIPVRRDAGTRPQTAVEAFKTAISGKAMSDRLEELMGKRRADKYKSSLIQMVSNSKGLQECSPQSVIACAVQNAMVGLEISPSFGFSAIIPYRNKAKVTDEYGMERWEWQTTATYQIMTKGWIQLAMRSGKYRYINVDAVYDDEYKGRDILTGQPDIQYAKGGMRERGDLSGIIGYFAFFELVNGARKVEFWTVREIEQHARTYSKSYTQYGKPIPDGWRPSFENKGIGWDRNWVAMAKKTVLKQLLTRWGVLSTEMEEAVVSDQATIREDGSAEYIDSADDPIVDDGFASLQPGGDVVMHDVTEDVPRKTARKRKTAKATEEAVADVNPIADKVEDVSARDVDPKTGELLPKADAFRDESGDFFDMEFPF